MTLTTWISETDAKVELSTGLNNEYISIMIENDSAISVVDLTEFDIQQLISELEYLLEAIKEQPKINKNEKTN